MQGLRASPSKKKVTVDKSSAEGGLTPNQVPDKAGGAVLADYRHSVEMPSLSRNMNPVMSGQGDAKLPRLSHNPSVVNVTS